MKVILLLFIFTATIAEAKKFALVIGGASKNFGPRLDKTPRFHEFGQASARVAKGLESQGYEVTTLFDGLGASGASAATAGKWPEDNEQFRKLNAQGASKANIEAALQRIVSQASRGDVVELNLFAHGFRACGSDTNGMKGLSTDVAFRRNTVSGCKHQIDLTDPVTGQLVRVDTDFLRRHLEALDQKGVRTNFNLASCHSGANQELFSDLPNTCTTYLASANNVGLGCFPTDKDGDPAYTSAIDMIMTSHWMNIADELARDPYFSADRCLGVSASHFREKNLSPSNRYDLFMNARRFDKNPHEPTISSQRNLNYFTEGNFSAVLANVVNPGSAPKLECAQNVEARIEEILTFGDELATATLRQSLGPKLARLRREIERYNELMDRQVAEIGRADSRDDSGMERRTGSSDSADTVTQIEAIPEGEKIDLLSIDFDSIAGSSAPAPAQGKAPEAPAEESRLDYYTRLTMEQGSAIMAAEREIIGDLNEQILRPRLSASDPCRR